MPYNDYLPRLCLAVFLILLFCPNLDMAHLKPIWSVAIYCGKNLRWAGSNQ